MEQYLWYSDRIQTVEKSGAEDISYVPWLGRLRTTMTHSTIWILVLYKVFWTQDTAGIYDFSQIQVLKTNSSNNIHCNHDWTRNSSQLHFLFGTHSDPMNVP